MSQDFLQKPLQMLKSARAGQAASFGSSPGAPALHSREQHLQAAHGPGCGTSPLKPGRSALRGADLFTTPEASVTGLSCREHSRLQGGLPLLGSLSVMMAGG